MNPCRQNSSVPPAVLPPGLSAPLSVESLPASHLQPPRRHSFAPRRAPRGAAS